MRVLGRVERFGGRLQVQVRTVEAAPETDPADAHARDAPRRGRARRVPRVPRRRDHASRARARSCGASSATTTMRASLRALPAAGADGHHGYAGGLLEHTVGVATLCRETAQLHPRLRTDLLLAAALLHDVGRTIELGRGPAFRPTEEGRLLGHVHLGLRLIEERAGGLDAGGSRRAAPRGRRPPRPAGGPHRRGRRALPREPARRPGRDPARRRGLSPERRRTRARRGGALGSGRLLRRPRVPAASTCRSCCSASQLVGLVFVVAVVAATLAGPAGHRSTSCGRPAPGSPARSGSLPLPRHGDRRDGHRRADLGDLADRPARGRRSPTATRRAASRGRDRARARRHRARLARGGPRRARTARRSGRRARARRRARLRALRSSASARRPRRERGDALWATLTLRVARSPSAVALVLASRTAVPRVAASSAGSCAVGVFDTRRERAHRGRLDTRARSAIVAVLSALLPGRDDPARACRAARAAQPPAGSRRHRRARRRGRAGRGLKAGTDSSPMGADSAIALGNDGRGHGASPGAAARASDVEADVEHVAVLDDVGLALEPLRARASTPPRASRRRAGRPSGSPRSG